MVGNYNFHVELGNQVIICVVKCFFKYSTFKNSKQWTCILLLQSKRVANPEWVVSKVSV